MCFISCFWDTEDDGKEKVKIEVINLTEEKVYIYYNSGYNREVTIATIPLYDKTNKQFAMVIPGRIYHAKGRDTGKDYGERKFVEVPSYVHDQQTWVIGNK
jgi:hypothetical protein